MVVKLPGPMGGPVSVVVAASAGGGGSAGGFGAIESPKAGGSAFAGTSPALNSQSAADVAAQARTTWRQDQRIEAVSSVLSPLTGWSLAKPGRFGRPLLSRQYRRDQIFARQQG
jgi:hypothetical protein